MSNDSQTLVVVENNTQFEEMKNHIIDSELICFDTETTGLNVKKDIVIGFSVSGDRNTGYYLPLYSWNGNSLEVVMDRADGLELLELLKTKKIVCHNASYDIRITKNNLGVDLLPSLHCDTIVLKHTCDEDFPFGLKDIAKKIQKHIGLDVDKEANQEQLDMLESIKSNGGQVTKEKYELYKADMYKIGIYAAKDTLLTYRVYEYYMKKLEDEGLYNFFYKDEVMPLLKEVVINMEDKGIKVDLDMLNEAKKNIQIDIEKLEKTIQEKIASHLSSVFEPWFLAKEFPPKRSGSFAQAVCEYANLSLPLTKSGRYSITEESLEALEPSIFKYFLLNDGERSEDTYLPEEEVLNIQRLLWERSRQEGEYMFNLSSKFHLSKLFFDTLKDKPISRTDKGNPQMNETFLNSVKNKYDFVPLLLDYNKLNKIKSAYIDRFLETQMEGTFYPRWMMHRTISGRFGGDLMQLTRPISDEEVKSGKFSKVVQKYTNMVRQFFISGNGYSFVGADYESLEPHVFSHVSGDEKIRDIFRNGHDFYSTIAIGVEDLKEVSADKKSDKYLGKINKPLRQQAKAYSLGIPYGLESFKLSKMLDIDQRDAQEKINNYLSWASDLHNWMKESERKAIFEGKIRTEAGRVRHLQQLKQIYARESSTLFNKSGKLKDSLQLWKDYNNSPKKYNILKNLRRTYQNLLNNAKNVQIQGLSASIVNRASIKISREFKRKGIDAYICMNIHDELVACCKDKHVEDVKKIMQYVMENNYKLSVDLKAVPETGKRYSEVK